VPLADQVLVVAAQLALDEYRKTSAYVCQPNRPIRDVERMAFYTQNQIAQFVPRIVEKHEAVEFRHGAYKGRLGAVVDMLLDRGTRQEGSQYKVLLLTPPDHDDTIRLEAPVQNDLTSQDTGRPIAFTQGQRYVSLARLRSAQKTAQLIG
jgi:hypothetical protein